MTPETEIMKELIGAVEQLNRPEWWSVGATIVAAIVAAWITNKLGKRQNELQQQQLKIQERQNELQEQQIRAQEYEIYSRLYKLVKKVDAEIDGYLDEIIASLGVVPWKRAKDGFLQRKFDYLLELRNELEQNALDFEIKFSKEFFNLGGYRGILATMIHNLQLLVKMVEGEQLLYDYGCSQTIHNVDGSIEKGQVYYIAQHIKDKQYEDAVSSNLSHFIEDRAKLRANGNDILEKIRERCKVE